MRNRAATAAVASSLFTINELEAAGLITEEGANKFAQISEAIFADLLAGKDIGPGLALSSPHFVEINKTVNMYVDHDGIIPPGDTPSHHETEPKGYVE